MMTDSRTCPNCQRRLFFMPDGRSLNCDHCGYRQEQQSSKGHPPVNELVRTAKWMAPALRPSNVRSRNIRDLLLRGVAAAKNGDEEEAFYYFERVLLTESTDEERAQAWLWMSGLYNDPAERRQCLEQVLALQPQNGLARRGMAILDGRLNPDDIIDPDKLEQIPVAEAKAQAANVEQFTCPRCNGRLHYTPDKEALACEFCDYRQAIEGEQIQSQYGLGEFEQDFIAAMHTKRGHLRPVHMRAFQCQACAVEFLLTPETLSVTCPYCDSVYVTETAETREILPPQALIPFAVSAERAEKSVRSWLKKQDISRPRLLPIIGIYLPLWTFDIGGVIKWRGLVKGGDNEWLPINGEKVIFYDDVLTLAAHKLPRTLAHKVLYSFDLGELIKYDPRYLADWPAERYQIVLGDAAIQARKQVLTEVRRRPGDLTGESTIHDLQISTSDMIVESFKQVLLPLWVAHYKLEDKTYDLLINGQTAEIFGERPQGIVGRLFGWLSGDQ